MSKTLPPITHRYSAAEIIIPPNITGGLPPAKAQSYIAIFEDALEQLAVLEDITPEAMKTDNKQVCFFNLARRENNENFTGSEDFARKVSRVAHRTRFLQESIEQNKI
jgi:hypothetical protein